MHHSFVNTLINETHNHALEQSARLVLHRKGATPAEKGQLGVIPANQRDGVYITAGLGNDAYLSSASHGAGRKFSRKAAVKQGGVKELQKCMKGIVCRADAAVLDEAPWAYKDKRLETISNFRYGTMPKNEHIKEDGYHFPRRGFRGKGMVISVDKFTVVKMFDKVYRQE